MLAKEVKPGIIISHEGNPILIGSMTVQSPSARGAATLYKFRGRNVLTKNKIDITFKGTDVVAEADFTRRNVQIMYSDPTHMFLMDQENYQQYELPLEEVAEQVPYISEGLEGIRALIYNNECIGIDIPASVELVIEQCDPGVKGNSATSRTKPATLETGLVIQVPEYMKQGERVKVDTRTGDFLSRA